MVLQKIRVLRGKDRLVRIHCFLNYYDTLKKKKDLSRKGRSLLWKRLCNAGSVQFEFTLMETLIYRRSILF